MSHVADIWRLKVLEMAWAAGSGHLGGSFSCAEILQVLYHHFMKVDANDPQSANRDRLILSKGHAAPILYAALADKGFFDSALLLTLRQLGSPLQGHPSMNKLAGLDMSTGSLGLGLSVAVGMALALRHQKSDAHVYVIMGDGECQEGQNWEAFMSMRSFALGSITPIIDCNGVQLDGTNDEVQPNQVTLTQKLTGFGLIVFEVDGHDESALCNILNEAISCGQAHAVVAKTIKARVFPLWKVALLSMVNL